MSSGAHPIGDPPARADAAHVMTIRTRYTEQQQASDRLPTPRRFRRQVPPQQPPDSVDEIRTERVTQMRERLRLHGYHVDAEAVAEAIVDRLREGGAVSGGARSRSSRPRPPAR